MASDGGRTLPVLGYLFYGDALMFPVVEMALEQGKLVCVGYIEGPVDGGLHVGVRMVGRDGITCWENDAATLDVGGGVAEGGTMRMTYTMAITVTARGS